MLEREYVEDRIHRVLQLSRVDETQATIMAHDLALTRYANNIIHQNVAENDASVIVKAVVGKRSGTATTNDLSDDALVKVTERAAIHARQSSEDPDFPGLPDPVPVEPVDAFDRETSEFDPESRALAVQKICEKSTGHALNAFGAFHTATGVVALANSKGVRAYHAGTRAVLQATISGDNGSSMAEASSWRVAQLSAEEVGSEAVEKAIRAQNPRSIEPGEYNIVLAPYAVIDIVANLNWTGVSARSVQEGRSWMNGRLGQAAMNPQISIWDDGRDTGGAALPFDFEGMPRRRVNIVEKGVVGQPVYDRYTAAKDGKESTGHASPPSMAWFGGPMAFHLFMDVGETSLKEMINSTERGLFINRFWYTRTVHPRDCIITGMTRDGVWMIENGELAYPVKDLRFTQSYVEALANVQSVGRNRQLQISEYGSSISVPALKIDNFRFTGRTA